jgi:hypothetical protein
MIVKIKNGKGTCWRFVEANSIDVRKIFWHDRDLYSQNVEYILQPDIKRSEGKEEPGYELTFLTMLHREEVTMIATDRDGYILNNEGKTIDRIN